MKNTNIAIPEASAVFGLGIEMLQEFAGIVSELYEHDHPDTEFFFDQMDTQFVADDVRNLPDTLRKIASMRDPQRGDLLDSIGMTIGSDSNDGEAGLLRGFADLVEAWIAKA